MRPGRRTTPRTRVAVVLLGLLLCPAPGLVAVARAAADDPAPPPAPAPTPDPYATVLPQSALPPESHARAHVAIAAGAALTITSFVLSAAADRAYARYQHDDDPLAIAKDYDAARRDDRWSAGTLLAGTGAFALGVYWRFIRHPAPARLSRVGVVPSITPAHAGLAVRVALP